jgi:hypothetical protein
MVPVLFQAFRWAEPLSQIWLPVDVSLALQVPMLISEMFWMVVILPSIHSKETALGLQRLMA